MADLAMIDYSLLKTEIQTDPLPLGYSGKTDAQIAVILNTVQATLGTKISVTTFTTAQLFRLFDPTELAALSAVKLSLLQIIMATGTIDATDPNTRTILSGIFPAGTTRTALVAALTRNGSRAEQIFGAGVRLLDANDVALARVA